MFNYANNILVDPTYSHKSLKVSLNKDAPNAFAVAKLGTVLTSGRQDVNEIFPD